VNEYLKTHCIQNSYWEFCHFHYSILNTRVEMSKLPYYLVEMLKLPFKEKYRLVWVEMPKFPNLNDMYRLVEMPKLLIKNHRHLVEMARKST
jgi:hypothetical protein